MMKLLKYILGVIIIVVIADYLVGFVIERYLDNHRLPGDCAPIDYVIREADEDMIVIGSSIALNSIMPEIIQDSLSISCFNGAANGQRVIFFKTILECIYNRYSPKYVLLGMKPNELCGTGIGDRYNILAPYYNKGYHTIDSCLETNSRFEPYLLKSTLYRYNTIWWRMLLYFFTSQETISQNGFVPKSIPRNLPRRCILDPLPASEERLTIFHDIVNLCESHGTQLLVFYPPMYVTPSEDTETMDSVAAICEAHHIPIFNNYLDQEFNHHPDWFYDFDHLNKKGAEIYTKRIVSMLKSVMNR